MHRGIGIRALLALALMLLAACSSAPRIKVLIDPAADTNGQLPCYVLIRAVDEKSFIAEPYQSVADLVMSPDASVLGSTVVFPGRATELELTPPAKGQLAAYVLFTYPDGDWKTLFTTPLPKQVRLSLQSSRLSLSAQQ
ncbi:hypothetical protein L6R52_05345 [Myxococcota bacterium]|nr:hypothetical protein [Myxococcota bacterium]